MEVGSISIILSIDAPAADGKQPNIGMVDLLDTSSKYYRWRLLYHIIMAVVGVGVRTNSGSHHGHRLFEGRVRGGSCVDRR